MAMPIPVVPVVLFRRLHTFRYASIRNHATSAEKRKLRRLGALKKKRTDPPKKTRQDDPIDIRAEEIREKGVNWKPVFFLGIFPILMSGVVVMLREDLQQELEEKGIGRLFADFRAWRESGDEDGGSNPDAKT